MEKPELKLLLNLVKDNGESFFSSFTMPLEPTTIESFIKQRFEGWLTKPLTPEDETAMHLKSVDHLALYRSEEVSEAFYAHNVKLMRPILAMLLYLCTTEPDIVSNRKPGLKPANNVQQVRENDPTRVTGFVANILETPIAKEERLRAHRVSALKLYHAACLKDKAQREAQEAADAVRAASKAKREVERNRRHQEAKAKAARAGAFHPHSAKTEASSPAIQQLDSERLVERVRTLEGEIDHLSGRNAELESRIEAMKLETDSLKQLNSDLSEKRGNVLDEEAVKGILSRLCLDAQYEPTPEEALQCVAALHGDRVHVLPSAWESARKVNYYGNGRRLLSLLMKLATTYVDAMVEGGDVMARRVFTASEYAGRESYTIMQNRSLMRARTWRFQNRDIPMVRHLKIGVSTDTRHSIRVYFEFLSDLNKIVIGWCGEHRPVPGVTS